MSGSTIRWWWSNGLRWNILYGSGVWFATYWWLGFGYWSVDHVTDRFTEYQGFCSLYLHAYFVFMISYSFVILVTCLLCFHNFLLSFVLLVTGGSSLPCHETSRLSLQSKLCLNLSSKIIRHTYTGMLCLKPSNVYST